MPSGVSQSRRRRPPAPVARRVGRLRGGQRRRQLKSGIISATPSASKRAAQDVERVAAGVEVAVDAVERRALAGQPDVLAPAARAPRRRARPARRRPCPRSTGTRRRRRWRRTPSGGADDDLESRRPGTGWSRTPSARAVRGTGPERGEEHGRPRVGGVGAVAQRLERLRRSATAAARRRRPRPARAAGSTGCSSGKANSLTPVIGARRCAMSSARASRVGGDAARRSCRRRARPARRRPARSR